MSVQTFRKTYGLGSIRRRVGMGRKYQEGGKLQMKVKIADRKEWNATDALVWLCVLNLEQGKHC